MDTLELLEIYKKEITSDVKLDQLNILDRTLMLPAVKHKWVARLIDTKKNLNALLKKKKETRSKVLKTMEGDMPKGIPKTAIDAKIDGTEIMQNINDDIDNHELMVEYLEKVEKIFSELYYGIKSAVELIKLETT